MAGQKKRRGLRSLRRGQIIFLAVLVLLTAATGALMSPTTAQQGESIPAICHAVAIESGRC